MADFLAHINIPTAFLGAGVGLIFFCSRAVRFIKSLVIAAFVYVSAAYMRVSEMGTRAALESSEMNVLVVAAGLCAGVLILLAFRSSTGTLVRIGGCVGLTGVMGALWILFLHAANPAQFAALYFLALYFLGGAAGGAFLVSALRMLYAAIPLIGWGTACVCLLLAAARPEFEIEDFGELLKQAVVIEDVPWELLNPGPRVNDTSRKSWLQNWYTIQ